MGDEGVGRTFDRDEAVCTEDLCDGDDGSDGEAQTAELDFLICGKELL